MAISVDDSSPFGRHSPGRFRRGFHRLTNHVYKAGWLGRRAFGRLRWMERLWPTGSGEILDVDRFGLHWRLYGQGNVADARLLLRPDAFEPAEIAFILESVRPGYTFIDIGANCGFYTLRVAHAIAGKGGRVIAVEPHPQMRRRLAFNAALNSASDVVILSCAVGDRCGMARLLEGQRNLGESRVSDQGSIEVEIRTLENIVTAEKLQRVDAIKVDVEGLEDRVLDPFFRTAPDSLLPRAVVAEYRWSESWRTNWLLSATARGYRERLRTRQGNVILTRL